MSEHEQEQQGADQAQQPAPDEQQPEPEAQPSEPEPEAAEVEQTEDVEEGPDANAVQALGQAIKQALAPDGQGEYGVKNFDGGDAGEAEVQSRFDKAADKGYFGATADQTPNENYSLETGPDAPTPETDEELARKQGNFGRFAGSGALNPNGEPVQQD